MRQRARFVFSTLVFDLLALAVSLVLASIRVFDVVWLPSANLLAFQNPRPMLGLLVIGVLLGSWLALRVVDPALSRPNYGHALFALAIAIGMVMGAELGVSAIPSHLAGFCCFLLFFVLFVHFFQV